MKMQRKKLAMRSAQVAMRFMIEMIKVKRKISCSRVRCPGYHDSYCLRYRQSE